MDNTIKILVIVIRRSWRSACISDLSKADFHKYIPIFFLRNIIRINLLSFLNTIGFYGHKILLIFNEKNFLTEVQKSNFFKFIKEASKIAFCYKLDIFYHNVTQLLLTGIPISS